MSRWRRVTAATLLLALAVFVAVPGAQGQFWVLVNGALNYTGPVTVNGVTTHNVNAIAATSMDGLILANNTDATAGIPVQQSPRLRLRSNVWNTTAVAATNTNDWVIENLPTSAAVPSSRLMFKASLNGAAYVTPLTLDTAGTVVANGSITAATFLTAGPSSFFTWEYASRNRFSAPADGQANLNNFAVTSGVGLDFNTDSTLKIRTRAQTGYATVDALAYQTSGVPGVGFALAHANPADQTGNATATLKMNGLGAAAAPCTITPTSTGRVIFTVTGDLTNSTILDGVTYKLVYGTGAAPANAATATGTVISATRSVAVSTATQKQGFSVTASATGLSLVATWFDLQIADVTGGTASVSNIDCTAYEI